MITNKGRELIGKYLLGQSNHYADYLAIGCGYNQMINGVYEYTISDKERKILDYEMIRVPIISRGVISEIEEKQIDVLSYDITDNLLTLILEEPTYTLAGETIVVNISAIGLSNEEMEPSSISNTTVVIPYTHGNASGTTGNVVVNKIITKLTFKAQLPNEQRFKITEVGIFSDYSNLLAGRFDSKKISGFLPPEGWQDKNSATIQVATDSLVDANNDIVIPASGGAFMVTDENSAWDHPTRKITLQPPRYFDHSLLTSGDFSTFSDKEISITHYAIANNILTLTLAEAPLISAGQTILVNLAARSLVNSSRQPTSILNRTITIPYTYAGTITKTAAEANDNIVISNVPDDSSNYIKTNSIPLNLNENNASDQIKLAFALIPRLASYSTLNIPDKTTIVVDLLNDYAVRPSFARWTINKDKSFWTKDDGEDYFYTVETTTKGNFILSSPSFSWASINGIRIFTGTEISDTETDTWLILLDGLRLENVSKVNPLYGLVGYSVVETSSGQPIIKRNNTVNFIEYRFTVEV